MTLEAVVHRQQGLLSHNKDLCTLLENWGWDFNFPEQEQHHQQHHNSVDQSEEDQINANYLGYNFLSNQSEDRHQISQWDLSAATATSSSSSTRPKRRRARSRKNQQDIESQRMTHIAVERNRRKQMNEYLSVLKSLMPDSYSQRGDQASIVGGAINVVKELEHNLHWLSVHKVQMSTQEKPFGEFFTFPQYSTTINTGENTYSEASRVADIEATMVESHANLKIRSKKRPKQLLKLVSGLQEMRLNILHLNVITSDPFALYSLSIKVEDDSQLSSADEIARAVHQLLGSIEEEEAAAA